MVTKAEYDQAYKESSQLTSKPSDNDLLDLYGLSKVVEGKDITKEEKPGMMDFKKKYKLKTWQKFVDEGISAEEAMDRYVAKVNALKESCGFDANKVPEKVGS